MCFYAVGNRISQRAAMQWKGRNLNFSHSLDPSARVTGYQIAAGVHAIEAPIGERVVRLFLLKGQDRALLIDTGLDATPRDYLLPYLGHIHIAPNQIRYVLITHCDFDHQGGNASVREIASEALFLCHGDDRRLIESTDRLVEERYGEFREAHGIDDSMETKAWIRANSRSEVMADITLSGGESIRLDKDWSVEILHTPGHSLGHLTVHDPRSRTLIIADAVLWKCVPTRDGRAAFPPTYRYLQAYRRTVQTLRQLNATTMLTSHYPVLRGAEINQFLDESIAFTQLLDGRLRKELQLCPRLTTRELIDRIAPSLGSWPPEAAVYLVFPLVGHLEELCRVGAVQKVRAGGLETWSWNAS